MASKRKRGGALARRSRPVSKPILDFSTALEKSQRALEQNQAEAARHFAEKALEFVNQERNPQAAARAHHLLAEAHFRLAAHSPLAQEQESHLDTALTLFPNEARFHFHRAVALFRQARLTDAAAALDKATKHPGTAFVGALLQIADNQPWRENGLTAGEANTLRLLQAAHQNKPEPALRQAAQQPLLGSNEIWQALIDLRADPNTTAPEHLQTLADSLPSSEAQAILHYYAGVAAISQGRKAETAQAWEISAASGWSAPWQRENREYLGRENLIGLAQEEKWKEIVKLAEQFPNSISDRILSETIGAAYFVLGYQAAEAARWQEAAALLRTASKYTGDRTLSQNLALCEEALENWSAAADAWREMARRRPRSTEHPDYMTDAQVAALWAHAAECYEKAHVRDEEIINCLRTAVKYAEDDVELRTKLADALFEADRTEAAENELTRILGIDENHVPTLLRLAQMAMDKWDGNPVPLFRKVLANEPDNQEARDSLANYYLQQVMTDHAPRSFFDRLLNRGANQPIKLLKEALQDLPDHPRILMVLGIKYREAGQKKEASATLQEAYRAHPAQAETVGIILHELLHLGEFSVVEQMMAEIRQLPNLLMGFWISQGRQILSCQLKEEWAVRFFDEALLLADKKRGDDSRPSALVQIIDAVFENDATDLLNLFVERVRAEMPQSGILEYTEARILFKQTKDGRKAQRVLRKAKRMAQKMGDRSLIKEMDELEMLFSGQNNLFAQLLRNLDLDDDDAFNFF